MTQYTLIRSATTTAMRSLVNTDDVTAAVAVRAAVPIIADVEAAEAGLGPEDWLRLVLLQVSLLLRHMRLGRGMSARGTTGKDNVSLDSCMLTQSKLTSCTGHEDEMYGDRYGPSPGPYSPPPSGGYLPPQQDAGYPPQQAYPSSNYFPPPPTGDHAYAQQPYPQQQQQQAYPAYNPADWAQSGGQQNPYDNTRGAYGDSDANLGAPYANDTFAGDPRYAPDEHPPTPRDERRRGRDPENVSAPSAVNNERETQDAGTSVLLTPHTRSPERNHSLTNLPTDGVNTPRARSSSRVRFDLGANEAISPEQPKKKEERYSDSETNGDRKRRHKKKKHRDRDDRHREEGGHRDSPQLMNDKYERPPTASTQRDDDSDGTIEMPERFDEHGNRKNEHGDPWSELIGGLASKFLGGEEQGHGGSDSGSRSGRRRHRH